MLLLFQFHRDHKPVGSIHQADVKGQGDQFILGEMRFDLAHQLIGDDAVIGHHLVDIGERHLFSRAEIGRLFC